MQRFYDLLLTSDCDVLQAVLYCTYRSTGQYLNRTPLPAGLMPKFADRMLALTKGWDRLLVNGVTLAQVATAEDYTPPTGPMNLTFYPIRSQASSSTSFEPSVTVDIASVVPSKTTEQLVKVAEEMHMGTYDQLLALTMLRLDEMRSPKIRQQMVALRCLAFSIYGEYLKAILAGNRC